MRAPGVLSITLPPFGSKREAWQFVEHQRGWIEKQLARLAARPSPADWVGGEEIWYRGARSVLKIEETQGLPSVLFGDQRAPIIEAPFPVRAAVEKVLKGLAVAELPGRLRELAAKHGFQPSRVVIRNQKSRWGSCNIRKSISLNWRLVMAPAFVRDYIILHELCHLRVMSHSDRYWAEVDKVCPDWRAAEKWIKQHGRELW